MTTSRTAPASSPGAATLITLYEGAPPPNHASWLVVQVDGATDTKLGLVALYLTPSEPKTSFTKMCASAACPEIEVGPSKVDATGRTISFRGLVLSATEGGGDVTLTGDLEAQ